jgi:hypothetical protein
MENIEREFEVVKSENQLEGVLTAIYEGFEEKTITSKKTNKEEKVLKHSFRVKVREDKEISINTLTDLVIRPGTKFGKLFKALTGREPQPGDRFSPAKFIGREVLIITETDSKGYAKIINILQKK